MHALGKQCSKCGEVKSRDAFCRRTASPDGLAYKCRECNSKYNTTYKELGHKKKSDAKSYVKNRESILEYHKGYYQENKEKIQEYRTANQASRRERDRNRNRYSNDVQFRLTTLLRTRLNVAVRNEYKAGSAVRDLGCSVEDLKKHLESKFQSGMSWENYGEWHIDHIKPLASFDLTDREQFLQACHYTNLQPLWAEENLKKGASC